MRRLLLLGCALLAGFSGSSWAQQTQGSQEFQSEPGVVITDLTARLDTRLEYPQFGRSMACADIDGDGFDEVITGATAAGYQQAGALMVWKGPNGVPWRRIPHPDPAFNGWFGAALVAADFDGDGFGDIAASSNFRGSGNPAVWVFFGPELTRTVTVEQPLGPTVASPG